MGDGTTRVQMGRLAGVPIVIAGQWSPTYLTNRVPPSVSTVVVTTVKGGGPRVVVSTAAFHARVRFPVSAV